jgi:peptide/nickel transport system substrate-binding protein
MMDRTLRVGSVIVAALVCLSLAGAGALGAPAGTTLVVGNRDPVALNPNYDLVGNAYYVAPSVFDKLVEISVSGGIVPSLARSWRISPDGKTYTFTLESGVAWHDGMPFTSEDVKWSIESVVKEKGVAAKLLAGITRIETPNPTTVVITLNALDSTFLSNLGTYYGFFILPKRLYENTDVRRNPYNLKPVGTGPYRFVEWVKGDHLTFEANPRYFKGKPGADRLIFKMIEEVPVALAALEAGEINTTQLSISYSEAERLRKNQNLQVAMEPSQIMVWLGFNLRKKPFDDVRVRRAIASAIDRDALARIVYRRMAPGAAAPYLATVKWAYNADAKQPAYNTKVAEQLLDEAGYKRGGDRKRMQLSLSTFRGSSLWGLIETAYYIKSQLQKIGIDADIELTDFATWTDKVNRRGEFDLAIAGGVHGPEPSSFEEFVGSAGVRNAMAYKNPRVDDLFQKARATADQDQRAGFYKEIQALVAQDLPRVSLVQYTFPRIWSKGWTGMFWEEGYRDKAPQHYFGFARPQK